MQITKFTDLSLRVLMYLTQQPDAKPVTISEIAQQFNVPRNHLIKVVTRLNKLQWITAKRGRSGGLSLAIPAMQLKLGNVIQELENRSSLINCETPPCVLMGHCQLKRVLDSGLAGFYQQMNQYSLQDIIDTKTEQFIVKLHQLYVA